MNQSRLCLHLASRRLPGAPGRLGIREPRAQGLRRLQSVIDENEASSFREGLNEHELLKDRGTRDDRTARGRSFERTVPSDGPEGAPEHGSPGKGVHFRQDAHSVEQDDLGIRRRCSRACAVCGEARRLELAGDLVKTLGMARCDDDAAGKARSLSEGGQQGAGLAWMHAAEYDPGSCRIQAEFVSQGSALLCRGGLRCSIPLQTAERPEAARTGPERQKTLSIGLSRWREQGESGESRTVQAAQASVVGPFVRR